MMSLRRLMRCLLVTLLVVGACLGRVSVAAAGGLTVRDDAGVLTAADQNAVRDAAGRAPFSVRVWTVKGGYAGNKPGFVAAADALVTGNDTVLVAVDTTERFSHVAARNARLTPAAATAAKSAADSAFSRGQWAAGVSAAIDSLSTGAGAQRVNTAPPPAPASFPWAGLMLFILLILLIGGAAAGVLVFLRSRRRTSLAAPGAGGPQDSVGPAYGPVPGGPAGYGPGYAGAPGYGWGPGSGGAGRGLGGVLAGGALGGIGGGLLGYELGKEAGEHQGGPEGGGGYAEQGGGGFVESDQGGGGADWNDNGGGDFGGGGGDF